MNAKVGNAKEKNIVGLNGLGKRNEAGEQFIHFWQSNEFFIIRVFNQNDVYVHGPYLHTEIKLIIISTRRWNSSIIMMWLGLIVE